MAKFFVPQTKPKATEAVYQHLVEVVKDQLRWSIADRRILRLEYTHDKKLCSLEVGQLEGQGKRYEILAIFDSQLFVVVTRAVHGGRGVTILVNKTEVTAVEEFDGYNLDASVSAAAAS